MANRRHYVLGLAGVGGRVAGMVLVSVPLIGVVMSQDYSLYNLGTAAPFVLLGAVLAFGSRGVTPDRGSQRIVRWYGLSLTRWLALPLWRTPYPIDSLQHVCIRGYDPSRGRGPSKAWSVLLVPKRGYSHAIAVTRHLLFRNAEKTARAFAQDTGLPLEPD